MSPPKRKTTPRDQYDISGKIEGQAVVVQGPDARVEVKQTQLTPEEIRQQNETAELRLLQQAVIQKIDTLQQLVETPAESGGNPFRFGQALGLNESHRLAGSEKPLNAVLGQLQRNASTFVAGAGGCGKTSFLQAGIIPSLTGKGHLPVLVPVGAESLEVCIKRQFVDKIANTQYLSQVPLSAFLRHVTECLPDKAQLFLLIDRSEEFLGRSEEEINHFKTEWAYCITNLPRLRWLFSIHLGSSYLLNSFEPETNPFHDLVILGLLDREAAREAILEPAAKTGIEIDERIVDDILDQLGPKNIVPCQLQTVCYMLAGGSQALTQRWKMDEYEKQGRANGILQKALEQIVKQFKPDEREPAWQVLACLTEQREYRASWAWLKERLKEYELGTETLKDLVEQLETNHLIEIEEDKYRLATPNFIPRIQQWITDLAVSRRAEMEAKRQARYIRDSSLRGLLGGAIGFVLFDKLFYPVKPPDPSYAIMFVIMTAGLGAIAGLLLTFFTDLSIATYRGRTDWRRYLVGGVVGVLATLVLLSLYNNFNFAGVSLTQSVIKAAPEAIAWGLAIGLGITWVMSVRRYTGLVVLLVSALSGLVLLGAELVFGALVNPAWESTPSPLRIFLAGGITPLLYLTAALWRQSSSKGSEA
ncbi:MAG: hypothetical protein JW963_12860 [Anaerolineales bacterium]|nr:hypothetical protein [Anaerolineales bacterium]